jgi:hypothetical protein
MFFYEIKVFATYLRKKIPCSFTVIKEEIKEMDIKQYLEAQNPNLCLAIVDYPQPHALCENNLGIFRKDMPQLSSKIQPHSIAEQLKNVGVLVLNEYGGTDVTFLFLQALSNLGFPPSEPMLVPTGELKVTQNEVVVSSVLKIIAELEKKDWQREIASRCESCSFPFSSGSPLTSPILVSSDGYVLDGMTRLSAINALGIPSGSAMICVRVIPMKMKNLVKFANQFATAMGMLAERGIK